VIINHNYAQIKLYFNTGINYYKKWFEQKCNVDIPRFTKQHIFLKKANNTRECMDEEVKQEARTIKRYDEVMTPSSRQQGADIHRRKSHQNICKLNAINAL
jgi:hypothetical protein